MIKIDYPPYHPKIKNEAGKEFIFDGFRKKWILLTPEEWVRQNFLQYLVITLNYPASLIAIEKEIYLGEVKKRFDIVVYDNNTKPFIVIECKEMNVILSEKTLHQALRYNTNMQARFIIITNGSFCFAFEKINNEFVEINVLPAFKKF